MIAMLFLFSITALLFEDEEPQYFPNIDYFGKGYNIYYGQPQSHNGDTGFMTNNIFHFTYNQ